VVHGRHQHVNETCTQQGVQHRAVMNAWDWLIERAHPRSRPSLPASRTHPWAAGRTPAEAHKRDSADSVKTGLQEEKLSKNLRIFNAGQMTEQRAVRVQSSCVRSFIHTRGDTSWDEKLAKSFSWYPWDCPWFPTCR
jgi:hypothetical protein